MKTKPTDPTAAYAQQIALMIQLGTLPSLEQVEAAILSTREEYASLIEAARRKEGQ